MTPDEYIKILVHQAEDDLGAAEALNSAGYYGQALFWLHLVLEKFCKALWVHKNQNTEHPFIHNLLSLLKGSGVKLTNEQIIIYSDMNQFQSKGRYAPELEAIEKTVTKQTSDLYFMKVKTETIWLKSQLQ